MQLHTLQAEPFSQSSSCWTLPLSRYPTLSLLFHFVPSHFCHCSTLLSFSCSAALRNQIFCIYFIEIFLITPPAHLFFTFSFSFGLLLKICPNIFDVYFRLKLEKIFSLGFSFCLFFFFGVGGLMVEKQRQQSG